MYSAQAEYVAALEAAMEAVWIRKFVGDLEVMPSINKPINMYCDNSAKVAKALKDEHNFEVDMKQMRNRFDYMKTKYGAWLSLKNRTGNIYDESTNTFNLTDEEWELEILKNKLVKPLKSMTLHFHELCAQLFDGTMANGIKSCGTRSHETTHVVEPHVIEDDEDIGVSGTTSQKPQSKVIAHRIIEPEQPPKPEPPTLEDCQNKLKTIRWAEDDPLYEVALAIFCEPNDRYREGWMQLKAERCIGWVKMIGRSKGFINMQERPKVVMNPPRSSNPFTYANVVNSDRVKKKVNFQSLECDVGYVDVDLIFPNASVQEVNDIFASSLFGYFIGKRIAYPFVEQYPWNK
nr:hypothetical protein [Tanacetum cinerariifolium]